MCRFCFGVVPNIAINIRDAAFLFILCSSLAANSDEPNAPLREVSKTAPYCGLVSAVSCLNASGVALRVEEVEVSKYVVPQIGSTVSQIRDLASDFGMRTGTRSGLCISDLKRMNRPAVLHVRPSVNSRELNHWIAYLGYKNELFTVLDPNSGELSLPAAELSALWDGEAIFFGETQATVALYIIFWRTVFLVMFFAFAICVSQTMQFGRGSLMEVVTNRQTRLLVQVACLIVMMVTTSIIFHSCSLVGLISSRAVAGEVARRFYHGEVQEIGLHDLVLATKLSETLILDVRFKAAFQRGSIPQAISLPIDSSLLERENVLKSVDKKTRIIVYCQSEDCLFSHDMSQFLLFNGYNNVKIYSGGFSEWEKSRRKQ